ncbi:hypothetical protein [Dyadobacter sp. LHD-138]|uniref:hypothetical protein n=1 Tax=Dyadobacter sp. LHD-138 TaxID=3071413 RepID=UPI0027E05606|nr:hypothetical protein [Dyadobacter sp. LHD-138]MDQ6478297.1 hypothetical protein [Dyadobacter sp. LHD-138]
MKSNLFKTLLAISIASAFFSCEKDDEEVVTPVEETEYKFVRILVNDELTNQLSLVDPVKLSVESFTAQYPKSALYPTQAGRFGVLVNSANNLLQLFDTGFEGHGDHVDVKGTPKFGALIGDGNKPTHFKSKSDEIITFNDGDGTLSIANAADFHVSGAKMKTINAGNIAHHGAMTKFDNGTYAITEKDGSVSGVLPERVKIIDVSGKTLFASTVQTKGIHGNASDGKVSLFGSSSGVLVVEPTGKQHLIAHPASFGTAWFGSILEARGAGKFIGYTAAVGAYLIDPITDKITPIIESADLIQVKVDYAGNKLIALLHSGEVKIYDLKTNSLVKSGAVIGATAKDEKQKPQIEATSRFLYITQPKSGELLKVEVVDFSKINKIKVSATPYRLTVLGVESSESH